MKTLGWVTLSESRSGCEHWSGTRRGRRYCDECCTRCSSIRQLTAVQSMKTTHGFVRYRIIVVCEEWEVVRYVVAEAVAACSDQWQSQSHLPPQAHCGHSTCLLGTLSAHCAQDLPHHRPHARRSVESWNKREMEKANAFSDDPEHQCKIANAQAAKNEKEQTEETVKRVRRHRVSSRAPSRPTRRSAARSRPALRLLCERQLTYAQNTTTKRMQHKPRKLLRFSGIYLCWHSRARHQRLLHMF